jgi:hypothetical protein
MTWSGITQNAIFVEIKKYYQWTTTIWYMSCPSRLWCLLKLLFFNKFLKMAPSKILIDFWKLIHYLVFELQMCGRVGKVFLRDFTISKETQKSPFNHYSFGRSKIPSERVNRKKLFSCRRESWNFWSLLRRFDIRPLKSTDFISDFRINFTKFVENGYKNTINSHTHT